MDCVPTIPALEKASSIAIAELSPSVENQKLRYFRGVVVLLWPYSSYTEQFKILVSDPDFRLRRSHGQIQVTFQGPTAERVAKSQIGIGDTVVLSLDGVEWEKKPEDSQTFTGETDWSLAFKDRVGLQIYRQSKILGTIDIDLRTPEDDHENRRTPRSGNAVESVRGTPSDQQVISSSAPIDSPFRINNSSAFDYAEERDEYVFGFGRKRTKFGRPSSEWVFVDSPPSPVRETRGWDTDEFDTDVEEKVERPEVVEHGTREALSPTPTPGTAVDQGHLDTGEGVGTVSTETQDELLELDPTNVLRSPALDAKQHEISLAKQPPASQIPVDIPAEYAPENQQTSSPEVPLKSSYALEVPGEITLPNRQEGEILDHPYARETGSLVPSDHVESNPDSEYPSKPATSVPEAPGSRGGFETRTPKGSIFYDDRSVDLTRQSGPFLQPFSPSLQGVERGYVGALPDATSLLSEEQAESIAQNESEQSISDGKLYLKKEWATNEELNGSVPSVEQNSPLSPHVFEGERVSDSGYSMDEPIIEEPITETDEQAENQAEEGMDIEFPPDTFPSSLPNNHIELGSESVPQAEVIVIDSDSGSDEETPRHSGHQNTLLPYKPDDADSVDLLQEITHDESSGGDQTAANVSFRDSTSDLANQDGRIDSRSQQESPIWLDGSVEHDIVEEASNAEVTSRQPTPSSPAEPCLGRATPDRMATPTQGLAIRSLSIPYRTAPSYSLRSKWREPLHTDSAMLTPAGTQETTASQSQELALPSTTTQPPTPQSSHHSQSIPSTAGTSEAEMSLDDAEEGAFWGRDTPKGAHTFGKSVSSPPPLSTDAPQDMDDPKDSNIETREELSVAPVATATGTSKEPQTDAASQRGDQPQLSWPIAGLRTRLTYFCPFSLLSENVNSAVDTMSVVASANPVLRGTRQPRDYSTTLHLIDPSTNGNTICAQIFRKNKDFLPVASKGDVILLKNFKVRSIDHRPMLCTMGHSSWAVFVQGNEGDVQINGPAVEYGDDERACAAELSQWYAEEGAEFAEQHELSNKHTSGSTASKPGRAARSELAKNKLRKHQRGRKSSERRLTVHHLRNGRRYTDMSSLEKESIHELRDGTVYAHPW